MSESIPAPAHTQLEWKESADGKSVSYAGKTYLPKKRALAGLGLPRHVLSGLNEGSLPNREPADVIHDRVTRAVFFNKELVDRLQRRFVYADNGDSLGRCRVHNGPWIHGLRYDQPRTETHLRSVSLIRKDIVGHDSELNRQFSTWLETGIGPDGIRVGKVRDTLTGEDLLSFRTLHELNTARRLSR